MTGVDRCCGKVQLHRYLVEPDIRYNSSTAPSVTGKYRFTVRVRGAFDLFKIICIGINHMIAFDDLYRPASLKVERAKHHINDLNARINAFLAEKPFELVLIQDVYAGRRTHEIETKKAIPEDLPLILGDAIHNLRSALDVVIYGIVGGKAKHPWKVQFPFSRKKDGLQSAISNAEVHLAGKHVISRIESAQPYEGGNTLLHGLNALDITDKHKLIITTARNTPLSADDFRKIEPDMPVYGPGLVVFTGDLSTLITVKTPRPPRRVRRANKGYTPTRHKPNIQPVFEIAFGRGEPFSGQPVVPKLLEIAAEIDALCRDLCTDFLKP